MIKSEDREEYDSFEIPSQLPKGDTEDNSEPIQAVETDGKKQLIGYAVVWGAVSSVRRDGFKHSFQKGSITWAVPTFALNEHDFAYGLASTGNNTLTITEDDYGAKVLIDLDNTTDGNNAFIRVRNKLINGMSFGGVRLAYDRTSDPKVINVTSFVANEVSLSLIPAMVETNIVTAANSADLQKKVQQTKESALNSQKNKLDKFKLNLIGGKASLRGVSK